LFQPTAAPIPFKIFIMQSVLGRLGKQNGRPLNEKRGICRRQMLRLFFVL